MSFTLCTSYAIIAKAGANANSAAIASSALLQQFSDEAEGLINARTQFDWVGGYAKVGANFKPMLADVCSSLAGAQIIVYNMSGYTNRGEAEDMINILHDKAQRGMDLLKDAEVKRAMGVV